MTEPENPNQLTPQRASEAPGPAERMAQNALGCLDPSDPEEMLNAIDRLLNDSRFVARASIKLDAARILLLTWKAAPTDLQEPDNTGNLVLALTLDLGAKMGLEVREQTEEGILRAAINFVEHVQDEMSGPLPPTEREELLAKIQYLEEQMETQIDALMAPSNAG